MRIWTDWQEAAEWLEDNSATDAVVCVSNWTDDGYLTVLKWDGRNLFVHPFPSKTGGFFFEGAK